MNTEEFSKFTNVDKLSNADFVQRFNSMKAELVRVKGEPKSCWKLSLYRKFHHTEVWAYRPYEARSGAHWVKLKGAIIERGRE